MVSDRETAENLAINALGLMTQADLAPNEQVQFKLTTAAIKAALASARAEERRKAGRAWLHAQRLHHDNCHAPRGPCDCGAQANRDTGRAYLDACAAEAGKETT